MPVQIGTTQTPPNMMQILPSMPMQLGTMPPDMQMQMPGMQMPDMHMPGMHMLAMLLPFSWAMHVDSFRST